MSDIREDLRYLSEEYESGEHVDISAQNYFQEALDEINRLESHLRLADIGIPEFDDE